MGLQNRGASAVSSSINSVGAGKLTEWEGIP